MAVLHSSEKLIAKETDVSAGSIGWFGTGVNDAYDLYLAEETSKNLVLILFMKLQFIFEDSGSMKWSKFDKKIFVRDFEIAVDGRWGGKKVLKTLASGKKVFLEIRFESLIDGWSIDEHWEIHVKKIKKGAFSTSSVNPLFGYADLDSEDLTAVNKSATTRQRGVVHEFGHMIGLPDEYHVGTPHVLDVSSIMNSGEVVRSRHGSTYSKWLNKTLSEHRIK